MEEKIGMCVECAEWTSNINPCCSAGIYFEGGYEEPIFTEDN